METRKAVVLSIMWVAVGTICTAMVLNNESSAVLGIVVICAIVTAW